MTTYLLAGGGTAGHVNPLLAVADRLRELDPTAQLLILGTAEGLEARLVPARGYELLVIEKLPFPRRLNRQSVSFLPRLRRAIRVTAGIITDRSVDVVVGFGGYASAPAYLAARNTKTALVLHEANAKPGLANRLGSRISSRVGVAFAGTPLRHARFVGMPLRREIETLDPAARRDEAVTFFGLDPNRPTVLVTGGSLGARRLNATIAESVRAIIDTGYQVLHIQGGNAAVADQQLEHYRLVDYCDRMELALAVADLAVSRAGAATVCELSALGIPAVYVPYPVGNGEQRFNARGVVEAGGALLVEDASFVPDWVRTELVPLLRDSARLRGMSRRAASVGVRDGSARMVELVHSAHS
ncbi:MAG: UDP-N-acetylglucosamine--N-acetylmuramyl-(pentapeptide) pyrophosphoryl-undecaprenol N-acetylglucosamine transferase [Microbacteriaceae bacterium]